MMKMKRILALCLTVFTLVSCVPAVYADNGSAQSVASLVSRQSLGASSYTIVTAKSRNNLTAKQKLVFDWGKECTLSNSNKTKEKYFTCTLDDAVKAWTALCDTYYQYYSYCPMDYRMGTKGVTLMIDCQVARGRYKRSEENKKLVAAATKKAIAGASTERVKVLRIRNYVCNKLSYKLETLGTLDNAIRGSKTKCSGYAALFMAMCKAAGIDCRFCAGLTDVNDEKSGHAWNRVKIGSKWYYSDPTWFDELPTSEWSLQAKLWSGRKVWSEMQVINFKNHGYEESVFD